jgi:hypothetical protein
VIPCQHLSREGTRIPDYGSGDHAGHNEVEVDDLLIATLYFSRESAPVRVRSLRSFSARIIGFGLPDVGAEIILRRGKLEAEGMVVWAANDQAGLSFRCPVSVSSWAPGKGSSQQRWIDRFVFGINHSQHDLLDRHVAVEMPNTLSTVVEDLMRLRLELGDLADKLAQDIILVATHPEVQLLDQAMQRIERIKDAVIGLGIDAQE